MDPISMSYVYRLDQQRGTLKLEPQNDSPLIAGNIIPVASGDEAEIELLRPAAVTDWVFESIDFWLFGSESTFIRVHRELFPTGIKTVYNFTDDPLVFDVKVKEFEDGRIIFSNSNQVKANPFGSVAIHFEVTLRAQSGLRYISKDPQVEDEPGG